MATAWSRQVTSLRLGHSYYQGSSKKIMANRLPARTLYTAVVYKQQTFEFTVNSDTDNQFNLSALAEINHVS